MGFWKAFRIALGLCLGVATALFLMISCMVILSGLSG